MGVLTSFAASLGGTFRIIFKVTTGILPALTATFFTDVVSGIVSHSYLHE
jgi:hypothetical protein